MLWRRTKLGLRLTVEQRAALGDFMAAEAIAALRRERMSA